MQSTPWAEIWGCSVTVYSPRNSPGGWNATEIGNSVKEHRDGPPRRHAAPTIRPSMDFSGGPVRPVSLPSASP